MARNLDPKETEMTLELVDYSESDKPFEDEGAPDDDFID